MIPDNLHVGPIPIHIFGVMMALGFLAASWIAGREMERKGFDSQLGLEATLWAAAGGLAGARLWVIVDDWQAFLRAPMHILFAGSGLVWYGGFVGGALAVTLYFRRHRVPWLVGADALAPALALGHAIGRIGCQLAGDGDWGKETTSPLGMTYPHAVVGWDKPPGVKVHPTPIYEFAAYVAVFFWLWRTRKDPAVSGRLFGQYLVLVNVARFAIEFVRINPPVLLGLTEAQWTSLALAGCGAVLWITRGPRESGIRPAREAVPTKT